jgi:hypothetical protein
MKFNADVETETRVYQIPGSPVPDSSRLSWNIVVNLDEETITKKPARGRPSVVIIEGNQEFFWEKLDKLERSRRVSREDNFVIFRKKGETSEANRVQIADDDVQRLVELGF